MHWNGCFSFATEHHVLTHYHLSLQVEPTMFPLIVFLMIKATFKYGINASSCDAFGSLAMLLCGPFGKLQEGRKMLKALDLTLVKPGMERMKARSIFGMIPIIIRKLVALVHKHMSFISFPLANVHTTPYYRSLDFTFTGYT